jgi:CMP/dCMP kinase
MQMLKNKRLIIAIDGYSSCGKSTLARQLAAKLAYKYIDTGAMYRAVTLYLIENKIDTTDKQAIINALEQIEITFTIDGSSAKQITLLNNKEVETEIRSMAVSRKVSQVSKIPEVRDKLVKLQQKMGEEKGIVMDGRDIGTKVFPDADLKLFMTADEKVRAQRRFKEINSDSNPNSSFEEILENIKKRDLEDTTREFSPLTRAEDAIEIDNTDLSIDEQLQLAIGLLERKLNS